MNKPAIIVFKTNAETKRKFNESVKTEGKTSSQWLRAVVEAYVRRKAKGEEGRK
jgi:predicted DNA-binding protein